MGSVLRRVLHVVQCLDALVELDVSLGVLSGNLGDGASASQGGGDGVQVRSLPLLARAALFHGGPDPSVLLAAVGDEVVPVVGDLDVCPGASEHGLDLLHGLGGVEADAALQVESAVLAALHLVAVERDAADAYAELRRRGNLRRVRLAGVDGPCEDPRSLHVDEGMVPEVGNRFGNPDVVFRPFVLIGGIPRSPRNFRGTSLDSWMSPWDSSE